ncbi:MAG: hypothetical protein HGB11_13845 [Chlorobiales bacterium]|nr:hypothetical protein [Chlorobiales bacterium]
MATLSIRLSRMIFLALIWFMAGMAVASAQKARKSPRGYPEKIVLNKKAFADFEKSWKALQREQGLSYRNQVLDSVGGTVSQLTLPVKPIKLNLNISNKDTLSAALFAVRGFIDKYPGVFHTTSKEIVPSSVVDYGKVWDIICERALYNNFPAAGQSRGKIEFIIGKSGDVHVLASTMTRKAASLPDSASFPKNSIYSKLEGRTLSFQIGEKKVQFKIDRLDVIKVGRVCVYEDKKIQDIYDAKGKLVERRLRQAIPYLAYEVNIGEDAQKPVATIFFDAITGKELAIDYPRVE